MRPSLKIQILAYEHYQSKKTRAFQGDWPAACTLFSGRKESGEGPDWACGDAGHTLPGSSPDGNFPVI
jgi:hypothetical protein